MKRLFVPNGRSYPPLKCTYVTDIEIGRAPIKFGAKTRYSRCAEAGSHYRHSAESPASDSVLE